MVKAVWTGDLGALLPVLGAGLLDMVEPAADGALLVPLGGAAALRVPRGATLVRDGARLKVE